MAFKVNKINTIEEYLVKDEYDYVYFFVDAQNGVLTVSYTHLTLPTN